MVHEMSHFHLNIITNATSIFPTGDIVSLSIFGRTLIILNSVEAANDLLYKKSSIYSDRPHLPMRGDL